jgi:hypothetical protein
VKRFRTIFYWLTPGWLTRGQGELVLWVQGLMFDAMAERSDQSARLMYPSTCPEDALAPIGHDRAIPRGPLEPSAKYRQRLIGWRYPRGHRTRGSALALLDQVAAALGGTDYRTVDQRGTQVTRGTDAALKGVTWDWDGASLTPNWGRYWIVVKSTGSLPTTWDESEASGETWDGPADECWAGEGIQPGEINAVRELARAKRLGWTPLGRMPIYLVIWFDGESYPAPTGDWDEWANRPVADYAFEPLHESVT